MSCEKHERYSRCRKLFYLQCEHDDNIREELHSDNLEDAWREALDKLGYTIKEEPLEKVDVVCDKCGAEFFIHNEEGEDDACPHCGE